MTTYAGHWGPQPFFDRAGRLRPDADVYVYTLATTTPITLYANRLKSATLANPLPKSVADGVAGLDPVGNGDFYADPGEYRMVVKINGVEVFDDTVSVLTDPSDTGASSTAFGLLAARPAAGTAGRLYFATNAGGGTLYLDNGSSWVQATPGVTDASIVELGYAENTVIYNTAAVDPTVSNVPGVAFAVTVGTRPLRVVSDGLIYNATPGAASYLSIVEDGVVVGKGTCTTVGPGGRVIRRAPSAGSHTYSLALSCSAGTAGTLPSSIIGPVSLTVLQV